MLRRHGGLVSVHLPAACLGQVMESLIACGISCLPSLYQQSQAMLLSSRPHIRETCLSAEVT